MQWPKDNRLQVTQLTWINEDMILQITIVAACYGVYYLGMIHPSRVLTASSIFSYIQLVAAAGTFALLDPAIEADRVYSWVVTIALGTFLLSNLLSTLARKKHRATLESITTYKPSAAAWGLVCASLAIVIAYYAAVGSSAFVLGIRNAVTGASTDVATARLNAYASERYFFPGYVNQFKNVLLPGMFVLLTVYHRREGMHHSWLLGPLGAVAILGLLGTGQRGAFVMFSFTVFVFLYYLSGKKVSRGALRLLLVATCIILISTVALGRSSAQWDPQDSWLEKLGLAANEFVHRVVVDQQLSAVAAFRYIYYQPIQNGAEWMQALEGVLPGSAGSDLSNRIYATMFGTARGTAPPSLWGSVYHNFGWPGILLFPLLLGILLAVISDRGTRPRRRNTLEMLGIAGVFVTLGFWAADPPTFLLNNGIVVYAAMWMWGRHQENRRPNSSRSCYRTSIKPLARPTYSWQRSNELRSYDSGYVPSSGV